MRPLSISILSLLVAGVPSGAYAQPAMTEATLACQGDVMRLCADSVPDRTAIIACMHRQRTSLSARCGAVFDSGTGAQNSKQVQRR